MLTPSCDSLYKGLPACATPTSISCHIPYMPNIAHAKQARLAS